MHLSLASIAHKDILLQKRRRLSASIARVAMNSTRMDPTQNNAMRAGPGFLLQKRTLLNATNVPEGTTAVNNLRQSVLHVPKECIILASH